MTDAGETSLRMAENLLRQSRRWAGSNAGQLGGLSHAAVRDSDGGWFYAQQHPLNDVWSLAPPLLVVGLEAWANCRGQLESEALTSIRPYMIVYRRRAGEWLCVEVGEKSSFATWLGWTWAKSAIGVASDDNQWCSATLLPMPGRGCGLRSPAKQRRSRRCRAPLPLRRARAGSGAPAGQGSARGGTWWP